MSRNVCAPQFTRNYGFWNTDEQQRILDARVAIAGVGGDGFQLGLKLLQMGVQTINVADPEVFEPENANRVPGATVQAYGQSKAEVFERRAHELNPDADIKIYRQGVTPENVQEFTERATLVFDESELTHLEIGTSLARTCRKRGIPDVLVMNIGFAALVTSFKSEGKWTFERFMGLPLGMPLDEVKERQVSFDRCLPYVPAYGDLRTLVAVQGGAPLPSIAPGVDVASALGSAQAFKHFAHGSNHRAVPVWAPQVAWMDAYSLKVGITRFPLLSHYRHLIQAIVRNVFGCVPLASYTNMDRKLREDIHRADSQPVK